MLPTIPLRRTPKNKIRGEGYKMTMHMICDKCKQKIKVDTTSKGKLTLNTAESGKEEFDICPDCVKVFHTWMQIRAKKSIKFGFNL